jgi:hypothetical protein
MERIQNINEKEALCKISNRLRHGYQDRFFKVSSLWVYLTYSGLTPRDSLIGRLCRASVSTNHLRTRIFSWNHRCRRCYGSEPCQLTATALQQLDWAVRCRIRGEECHCPCEPMLQTTGRSCYWNCVDKW